MELCRTRTKVFPSSWMQRCASTAFLDQQDLLSPGDPADGRDSDSSNACRNVLAGRGGEEELVVVPAMECILEIDGVNGSADAGAGYRVGQDLSADPGLVADVGEIGGEAVAEINHGSGQAMLAQVATYCEARDRVEVARVMFGLDPLAGEQAMEGVGTAAEFSGHIEEVAGPGAGAKDGAAAGNGSQDHDVGQDSSGRLCRISSRERDPELLGEGQEAV